MIFYLKMRISNKDKIYQEDLKALKNEYFHIFIFISYIHIYTLENIIKLRMKI